MEKTDLKQISCATLIRALLFVSIICSKAGVGAQSLSLIPDSLSVALLVNDSSTQTLTVDNSEGSVDLVWSIDVETNSLSPSYAQTIGQFKVLPKSPWRLASLEVDKSNGVIYGRKRSSDKFYRYDIASQIWDEIGTLPWQLHYKREGGASFLNGKIFVGTVDRASLEENWDLGSIGIYDTETQSWEPTITAPIRTGNIASDDEYLYIVLDTSFYKYDFNDSTFYLLSPPPFPFDYWGGLEYYNGYVYGHSGAQFARYNVLEDEWEALDNLPGGAVLGSVIDPVAGKYITYGDSWQDNLYQYEISSKTWSVDTIPSIVNHGGLVHYGKGENAGIYLIHSGNAFARIRSESTWLSPRLLSDTIEAGSVQEVDFILDASGIYGGVYEATISITSTDPFNPDDQVPVTLQVTGEPDITASTVSIDFGQQFIGHEFIDTLIIANSGTDQLVISNILLDNSVFTMDLTAFELSPEEEQKIIITYAPLLAESNIGTISVLSNDPNESILEVELLGSGLSPPVISVDRGSLSETLFKGDRSSQTLKIQNIGDSDLNYSVSTLLSPSSISAVESTLDSLNENYAQITSIIPDRYDFSDGETGSEIWDGGGDMYDGGNILSTNNSLPLNYTNGEIIETGWLNGGSYFTAKYPGLFVFVGEVAEIDRFRINGDLGHDGVGSVDEAIISMTRGFTNYLGFVKRVYGGKPSINHLVIVEDKGNVNHTYFDDTNSDYHEIADIDSKVLYYLLFSGQNNTYIDDNEVEAIMSAFLDVAGASPVWLRTGVVGGTVPQGGEEIISIDFDSYELNIATYQATLAISSNDPANSTIEIPVTLDVVANDQPVVTAFNGSVTIREDTNLAMDIADYSIIDDGQFPEDYSLTIFPGTNYTVDQNEILPSENFFGILDVQVTVSDGKLDSEAFRIEVTVEPVNDAPVIIGAITDFEVGAGSSLALEISDLEIEDVDNEEEDFTLHIESGKDFTVEGNVLIPTVDFSSIIQVGVTISDGSISSDIFTVEVTIHGPTSVPDNPEVTAYPNPAVEILTIETHGYFKPSDVRLLDLTGRTMLTRMIQASDSSVLLDLRQLSIAPGGRE